MGSNILGICRQKENKQTNFVLFLNIFFKIHYIKLKICISNNILISRGNYCTDFKFRNRVFNF